MINRVVDEPEEDGRVRYEPSGNVSAHVRYGWRGQGSGIQLELAVPLLFLDAHLSVYGQLTKGPVDVGLGVNVGLFPGIYAMAGWHSDRWDVASGVRGVFLLPSAAGGNNQDVASIAPFAVLRHAFENGLSLGLFTELMWFDDLVGAVPLADSGTNESYFNFAGSFGVLVGYSFDPEGRE